MTFHEGEPTDEAVRGVPRRPSSRSSSRASSAASCSSTTRGSRSRTRPRRSSRGPRPADAARTARRVPSSLVDGAGRARGHDRVPARTTGSRTSRWIRRSRGRRTSCRASRSRPTRRVRPVPRPQREDLEHPRRKSSHRFDWMYSDEELAEWVGRLARARRRGRRGLRHVQQQPRRLRTAQRRDLPRAAGRGGNRGYAEGSSRLPLRPRFSSVGHQRGERHGRRGGGRPRPTADEDSGDPHLVLDAERAHRERLASRSRAFRDDRHQVPPLPTFTRF